MCKKNITQPFRFFCYTEDTTSLRTEIDIIPFHDYQFEVIVHNKLFLFSKEMDEYLTDGPRLYLDLDLIIKQNIDHLVENIPNELTLIRSSWRPELRRGLPTLHHMFNSSCMVWRSPYARRLWEHFIKDPEYNTHKYHFGMDCFLSYEHKNVNTNIHFFPERIFLSLQHGGVDYHEQEYYLRMYNVNYDRKHRHIYHNVSIILLNGSDTFLHYGKFKQYYAD